MSEESPFAHILEDIQNDVLDKQQKMVLAKGFLPLDPEMLATALLYLSNDQDHEIASTAKDTVLEMPVNIVKNIAQNRKIKSDLIDNLAHLRIADTEILEAIILNPAVDNKTLEYVATHGPTKVIEILAGNQERMLSHSAIIDAILKNTNTPSYIQTRLEMFRQEIAEQTAVKKEEERLREESLARQERLKEKKAGTVDSDTIARKEATTSPVQQATANKPQSKTKVSKIRGEEDEEDISLMEEDLEEGLSISQKIQNMPVGERIKLAKFGTREERMLLVRETNKMVALAAISSPKTTEEEIEQIARMKNIVDDVLREIGNNREYTKSPTVRKSLLENPRTPVGVSLNLIKHVSERELNDLSKNRNIPEVIRTTARRMVIQRQQRKDKKSGKH